MNQGNNQPKRLFRSEKNRMLGGVAGGIAEYANMDPTIIRLIFVVLTIFQGSGILLYIILWIVIPKSSKIEPISEETIKDNVDDIRNRVEELANDFKGRKKNNTSKL